MKKQITSLLCAAFLAVSFAGCSFGGDNVITPDQDGYAEGKLGDIMRSSFFDYIVNSAYLCDSYEDYYTPQAGY